MIHGPSLNETRENAKLIVMHHFVERGEQDQVPPTLRAMYAIKVGQAQLFLASTDPAYVSLNRCIERDAEKRGYTPYQMAVIILHMAAASLDLEDERLSVNVQIDAAEDEAEIVAVLKGIGLSF